MVNIYLEQDYGAKNGFQRIKYFITRFPRFANSISKKLFGEFLLLIF
jgi:hypothetical protein